MRGVILDYASLAAEDLDLGPLESALEEWVFWDSTAPETVDERLKDVDVVLTNKVVLNAGHFERHPHLRLVVVMATGTNNVDLDAAAAAGVPVCNVADYSTPSVVQYTFAAILTLRTRLLDYHAAVAAGRWQASSFFGLLDYPIEEVRGSTLGIVGYGAIGRAVAAAAEALGFLVRVAESPAGRPVDEAVARVPLDILLCESDVVSLHCPLTEQTRGLIGAAQLARMKSEALLINAARGGIVDETALAEALRAGRLAGAAVDVLTVEPPPADHPLMAPDIPNLLVTPHIGWASRQARQRLVVAMADHIRAFREGTPLASVNGVSA